MKDLKDIFLSGLLVATGLAMVGASLGAAVWLVSFAFGAVSTIIEHGFALATNVFGG